MSVGLGLPQYLSPTSPRVPAQSLVLVSPVKTSSWSSSTLDTVSPPDPDPLGLTPHTRTLRDRNHGPGPIASPLQDSSVAVEEIHDGLYA